MIAIELAACRSHDDPDLWHDGPADQACAICRACPVRRDCLTDALAHDERHGVWGGATRQQRAMIRTGHYTVAQLLRGRPPVGKRSGAPTADTGRATTRATTAHYWRLRAGGASIREAARIARIPRSTVRGWERRHPHTPEDS